MLDEIELALLGDAKVDLRISEELSHAGFGKTMLVAVPVDLPRGTYRLVVS
jgi:hypothetical protein